MDIISLIIAILALLGNIFIFFFYDEKIKRQNAKINEYQLKKYQEEELETKKANPNISIKPEQGKNFLEIQNKGKNSAKNIYIQFLTGVHKILFNDNDLNRYSQRESNKFFICKKLDPDNSIKFSISRRPDFPWKGLTPEIDSNNIRIKIIWNDEFKKNNEKEHTLNIYLLQ